MCPAVAGPTMRRVTQLAFALALLATQVNVPKYDFGNVAGADQASAGLASVYEVKLNTASGDPVSVQGPKQPNYDTDVLDPLHAAQAAAAAAKAARRTYRPATVKPVVVPGTDVWAQLRYCESGGDYTRNSGNGYYGAYQYSLSTWGGYDGYARPDLAPPAVQDAKAKATQAARGWYPWPACASKLGLL
jgi:Transglycosylase-like domain